MNITWPEETTNVTLNDLENEFKRLSVLEDTNWESVRTDDMYDLRSWNYPFGQRPVYMMKENEMYSDYVDLQASRGLPHPQDYNWDWDKYFDHVHRTNKELHKKQSKMCPT